MKVGVYYFGVNPEVGGGYSFEQEVFSAFGNLATLSHHHFTIFVEADSSSRLPITESSNIKIVLLKKPAKVLIIYRLFRKVAKKIGFVMQTDPLADPLKKAVSEERIQFFWFPAPVHDPIEIPYIATVWDIQHRLQPWFPEVDRDWIWEIREAFFSAYLKRAAYIITPNRAGRDELALFYQLPPERFRLLPHPTPHIERLPTKTEVERVLEKYRLPRDYLFYPAQFWAHKNHVNLLLALQVLKETYGHKKHLVLTGFDHANILGYIRERSVALGLEDQVHFLGFIPREDLIALYCGAFALTYVSLFGPENLPPLEAFKCGCPVIASNVTGAKEQYGDAALLVDGLEPEEIARAIIRLEQEAGLRQTLIERGQKRAELYSGLDYVRDVMKIFDDFEKIRRNWESS